MPGKKKPEAAGVPDWMVTYGDAMTLLLCFFVIIVSMSEIKEDQRFYQVLESLRSAFGGYEGGQQPMPGAQPDANAMIQKLLRIEPPVHENKQGDVEDEGIEGKKFRVTNVRDGIEVVVGGLITFPRFSATLKPEAKELIRKVAEQLRGHNTKILVRGHATREPLPQDSMYEDARDLSYERAKAVVHALETHGVRAIRLIPVAVGDTEPLVRQAYTERRRALNRRVEILVTEDLIDRFAGTGVADEETESSDGR
ncbi:MAG: flagellar motor protein MotB [Phycisphaerae bacterium]